MDIEKIKTQMCDNYCKHFAEICATFEDIDRGQEVLDRICEHCPLNELEDMVEVVRGEWELLGEHDLYLIKCSACGFKELEEYNYCPNCGAKMRGGTE